MDLVIRFDSNENSYQTEQEFKWTGLNSKL